MKQKKLAIYNKYKNIVENKINGKQWVLVGREVLHGMHIMILKQNTAPITYYASYLTNNCTYLLAGMIAQGDVDYKSTARYKQLLVMPRDTIHDNFALLHDNYCTHYLKTAQKLI